MPYINKEKREELDVYINDLSKLVNNEGELNYCIYKLALEISKRIGYSYHNLSMCTSAMEHAKLEFYRKQLAPYEELKINENGDII